MNGARVPARRRILDLPEQVARVYQRGAAGGFDMRALCADLWLAVEMQSLTPDLRLNSRPLSAAGSSGAALMRCSRRVRLLAIPMRLDQAFARLARAHGFRPSSAIAFVMAWRAQHAPAALD